MGELIDWDTLTCWPVHCIDAKLDVRIADAVFLVKLRSGNGDVLLCLEHLSSCKRELYRLQRYALDVSEAYKRAYGDAHPLFSYNILLYNGRTRYPSITDFSHMLTCQEQRVLLIDMHNVCPNKPQDSAALRVFELALSHVFDPHLQETWAKLWPWVQQLQYHGDLWQQELGTTALRYVSCLSPLEDLDDMIKVLQQRLGKAAGEEMHTLMARLKKEGRQEGVSWGIQKGKKEAQEAIAVRLLQAGCLNDKTIAETTQLPLERLQALQRRIQEFQETKNPNV